MQKLLSNNSIRVFNILTKHLKDDESVYGLSLNRSEVHVQGRYNPRLVCLLVQKKFTSKVNGVGYLSLVKVVAGLEITFTFTD